MLNGCALGPLSVFGPLRGSLDPGGDAGSAWARERYELSVPVTDPNRVPALRDGGLGAAWNRSVPITTFLLETVRSCLVD